MAWRMLTIGELCEVVNGGTPKTGIDEYWNGKHLWITPAEMGKRESPYVFETERRITDAGLRNSSARLLPPNSVILSSRAPIGHLVINTEPMAFNQGCKGLVPGPSIHHKYLFYYLSSIVDLLNALGTGATFKELSGGKLKEVIVPVPPLAEQKRIVAILDEAFEGIRIATANAEKNLANARDLFDAELRCLFEESAQSYPMLALENLTERITKGSSPKWQGISYVTDGGILFVTSENVGQNRMLLDEPKFVDARFNEKDRKSILRRDDVLTNIVGASIGRTAVFESDDVANINQAVCLIRCKTDALLPRFLSALLNSDYFRRQLFANTTDTARANLSLAFFRSFEIPVPPIEVQQRIIEDVLSIQLECDALSMRYQEKCNGVSELKQSILSRAFSGQLTATKGLAA